MVRINSMLRIDTMIRINTVSTSQTNRPRSVEDGGNRPPAAPPLCGGEGGPVHLEEAEACGRIDM
eukprot:2499738-Rhodomonas_salina.2